MHAAALLDHICVSRLSAAKESAVVVKYGEDKAAVIEKPEVIGREVNLPGEMAGKPADVLPTLEVERCDHHYPPGLIGMRDRHDTCTGHALARLLHFAHQS